MSLEEIFRPEVREFFFVLLAICLYAAWRGRTPERIAALAMQMAWFGTQIFNTHNPLKPEYTIFLVDVGLLIVLVALAMKTGRIWLMAAAAFQLLTVGDHIAMMLDVSILSYTYRIVPMIWGYAVIAAMVLGTLFEAEPERRRLRQA